MHEMMDSETVRDLLGVKERQFRTYVNDLGLPTNRDGKNRTHPWKEVLEWYVELQIQRRYAGGTLPEEAGESQEEVAPSEDLRSAMLRKTKAEANLKELALSKQRSEVVTIADAKIRLDRLFGNMRSKLLGMAPKLASRIEGLKARTEREAVFKEEMEALCRELSTGAVVDLPADPDAVGELSAAEEVPAEPAVNDEAPTLTEAEVEKVYEDVLDLYASLEADAPVQ